MGILPGSQTVQDAEALGKTVLEAFPDSEMAACYRRLAQTVLAALRGGIMMRQVRRAACGNRPRQGSLSAPFPGGLEYSAPARGVWNIVHAGMLVPQGA